MVSLKTYKKSLLTLILCCALVPSSSSASFWHSWSKTAAVITASALGLTALGYYLYPQYQDPIVDIQEAFHEACKQGNLDNIKRLINKGADVNKVGIYIRDTLGYHTPLYYACCYDHLELAKLLIEHGADVNKVCMHLRNNHQTPLHIACYNGNSEIIHLLTQSGAKTDAKDWQGNTPRMHASRYGLYPSTSINYLDRLENKTKTFNDTTPATPGLLQRLIAHNMHDEYVLKHLSEQTLSNQKKLMFHALLHNTRILIKMVYYSYANHNELLLKPQMLEGNTYLQQKYEQFLKKVTHY